MWSGGCQACFLGCGCRDNQGCLDKILMETGSWGSRQACGSRGVRAVLLGCGSGAASMRCRKWPGLSTRDVKIGLSRVVLFGCMVVLHWDVRKADRERSAVGVCHHRQLGVSCMLVGDNRGRQGCPSQGCGNIWTASHPARQSHHAILYTAGHHLLQSCERIQA